jgi:endogenous inhibitor of DNA gyrase (YacG/DUF329 family)
VSSPDKQRLVNCPHCGKPVPWSAGNPHRPFCSERCRLIDLGQWATESYRIPVAENDRGSDPGREEE